jgi:hypothetical protein
MDLVSKIVVNKKCYIYIYILWFEPFILFFLKLKSWLLMHEKKLAVLLLLWSRTWFQWNCIAVLLFFCSRFAACWFTSMKTKLTVLYNYEYNQIIISSFNFSPWEHGRSLSRKEVCGRYELNYQMLLLTNLHQLSFSTRSVTEISMKWTKTTNAILFFFVFFNLMELDNLLASVSTLECSLFCDWR